MSSSYTMAPMWREITFYLLMFYCLLFFFVYHHPRHLRKFSEPIACGNACRNDVGTNFVVGVGEARPEGPRAGDGDGVLGEGAASPSHQLGGLRERCKLLQRGPGLSPGRRRIFSAVRLPFPASQYVLHTVCMARYWIFLGDMHISIPR